MGILVLTTGGTIGAASYENPESPPQMVTMPLDGIDLVAHALKQPEFKFVSTRCISLEPRDSKLIDETYCDNILRIVCEEPENEILITHGTDCILKTANYFYRQRPIYGNLIGHKTIILVGSMEPLANGAASDGYLNLHFALKHLQDIQNVPENNGAIFIVLCDYDFPDTESGAWAPRLYRYSPNTYKKFYAKDGRYNRLRRAESHD